MIKTFLQLGAIRTTPADDSVLGSRPPSLAVRPDGPRGAWEGGPRPPTPHLPLATGALLPSAHGRAAVRSAAGSSVARPASAFLRHRPQIALSPAFRFRDIHHRSLSPRREQARWGRLCRGGHGACMERAVPARVHVKQPPRASLGSDGGTVASSVQTVLNQRTV